jgi:3-isopropylmalate/(R)-2-methylmalate dehydratase small subunit
LLQALSRSASSSLRGEGPRFIRHEGITAPMLLDNVDTDVISPIGKPPVPGVTPETAAFEPLRFYSDGGERPEFVLNREPFRRASILLVGKNFGTGSSRPVAVSRPMDGGIRVVIGESFGPLFYDNSVRQGLLAVTLERPVIERLAAWSLANPGTPARVDLESETIQVPGMQPISFRIEPRVRRKLLLGLTEADELNQVSPEIDAFSRTYRGSRPWVYETSGQR